MYLNFFFFCTTHSGNTTDGTHTKHTTRSLCLRKVTHTHKQKKPSFKKSDPFIQMQNLIVDLKKNKKTTKIIAEIVQQLNHFFKDKTVSLLPLLPGVLEQGTES